jgi:Tol biopolymer transport system component
MPITGGKAKNSFRYYSFEIQPRYSPNGNHISFTSDAGGGDNIWTMKADMRKQITKED